MVRSNCLDKRENDTNLNTKTTETIVFHITVKEPVSFSLGNENTEGKSLMEQLRGEALKFHKPGETSHHCISLCHFIFTFPETVHCVV